jgi:hypothetical protein
MEELLSFGSLTALVVGLTEVVKRIGLVPERFIPLVAVFFGLLLSVLGSPSPFSTYTIFVGIAIGLSASGLFSGIKSVAGK